MSGAGMQFYPEYNWLVSPAMLYLPPVAYLACAVGGHRVMKGRAAVPDSALKPVKVVYNLSQIVLCVYMTRGLAPVLGWPNVFGLSSAYTAQGEWFVLVHFLSKYLDWLDTLWIVLKKKGEKQMSFLHLYHHATIGVVWGFMLSTGHGNGTVRYGAWINSVTHVILYAYYLLTSFGVNFGKAKYAITYWQLAQFASCFVHAILVITTDGTEVARLARLQVVYHISMLYLFGFRLHWVPEFIVGPKEGGKEKRK